MQLINERITQLTSFDLRHSFVDVYVEACNSYNIDELLFHAFPFIQTELNENWAVFPASAEWLCFCHAAARLSLACSRAVPYWFLSNSRGVVWPPVKVRAV